MRRGDVRKESFAPKADPVVNKPRQLQRNDKNGAPPSSFCQPLLLGSLCRPAQHSLFLQLKCRNICLPDHISYNLLYFKRHIMYCIVRAGPQKALSQPPSKVKLLLLGESSSQTEITRQIIGIWFKAKVI